MVLRLVLVWISDVWGLFMEIWERNTIVCCCDDFNRFFGRKTVVFGCRIVLRLIGFSGEFLSNVYTGFIALGLC